MAWFLASMLVLLWWLCLFDPKAFGKRGRRG
jgi:hypothetical protein